MNIREYQASYVLKDGRRLHVRAITDADKYLLQEGMTDLSKESVYMRFHGHKKELSDSELYYLTNIDYDQHVALICFVDTEAVAVGRYVVNEKNVAHEMTTAALALVVKDIFHGLGIGKLLLNNLIKIDEF